jgi:hypothetical protein
MEIGKPTIATEEITNPAHSSNCEPIVSEMLTSRTVPPAATTAVKAGHLIFWRSIPLAWRNRSTKVETAATNNRASMIVWTGL